MPTKLLILSFVVAFILGACGGDPDDDEDSLAGDGPREGPGGPVAAGGTPAPTLSPTPISTPGITLTPPPEVEANFEAAQQLQAKGELEDATDVYLAVALSQLPEAKEAALAAARNSLELNRPADAALILEELLPSTSGYEAAHYLLARAFSALESWPEALAEYDLYIASGGEALPYAYLDRASALLQLNQPLVAAASAETGLNLGVPLSAQPGFILTVAQSFERAGDYETAIVWFQRLVDFGSFAADPAFALSRIVDLKRLQDDPSYTEELAELLIGYPSSAEALSELGAALAHQENVSPVVQGLIFYGHGDYSQAEPLFLLQIDDAAGEPASAEAHYYLAAIQELRGEVELALANYDNVPSLNSDSGVADDARWWSARLLEIDGRFEEAEILLTRLILEYPTSSWAAEAAFRRGLLPYLDGRFEEAAQFWQDSLLTISGAGARQQISLWQAKALLNSGDDASAAAILADLAALNEDDYYGIRALGLLQGNSSHPLATVEQDIDLEPDFDWLEAERWLSLKTGRPVVAFGWPQDERWARASELWLIGREQQAAAEVFSLIGTYAQDPIAMFTLSRDLQAHGRTMLSARAGQRLLRFLDLNPNEGLPRAVLSLSYPAAFAAEITAHADANLISPLLLLAFIRQESFFAPRVESPAGALGLSQVLPETGSAVAASLGIEEFTTNQLLHADINLLIGTHYMSEQLDSFEEELFTAFAAYNAGSGAAKRWRQIEISEDPDLFLELVEFSETRLYIQFVAENYAIYRYLYGAETAPTLPD